jgi:hypothetical protein
MTLIFVSPVPGTTIADNYSNLIEGWCCPHFCSRSNGVVFRCRLTDALEEPVSLVWTLFACMAVWRRLKKSIEPHTVAIRDAGSLALSVVYERV